MHVKLRRLISSALTVLAIFGVISSAHAQQQGRGRWTVERAAAWEREAGWLAGSNYAPASAINQLEMWQAETWDPQTIARELGWAQGLGFNTMRVFLHDLAYRQDPAGFLDRVDQFLAIASRHGIKPMLVLFDAVWDPFPHTGRQRAPVPGLHNSGWVQAPGVEILRDSATWNAQLKPYVQGVIGRFGRDPRVLAWDLFNEPDNTNGGSYGQFEPANKVEMATALLRRTFGWAREMGPVQPLTAAPWHGDWVEPAKMDPITRLMLDESDIITFHSYEPLATLQRQIPPLKALGRPVICTEYMARPRGSTFESVLPFFRQQNVGAINWGFVAGKSQTIYPWDSWEKKYAGEPPVWFHDIFRADGTPYRPGEVELIRSLTRR
ncbi:MAG TPA: cellulase family glycosylhydrolase [Longimicrobium sp.]|nr:cellulase family glycosylhydrolase [Longimicrobium sp.]